MRLGAMAYRPRAALPTYGRSVRSTLRSPVSRTPREPDVGRTICYHGRDYLLPLRYHTIAREPRAATREDLVDQPRHPTKNFAVSRWTTTSFKDIEDIGKISNRTKLGPVSLAPWTAASSGAGKVLTFLIITR